MITVATLIDILRGHMPNERVYVYIRGEDVPLDDVETGKSMPSGAPFVRLCIANDGEED